MRQNLLQKALGCAVALGLALASTIASAQINGTIWETGNDSVAGDAGNVPSGPSAFPSAQFTTTAINFQSQNGVNGYTIGPFLNNPTFFNEMNGFNPTDTANDILIQLTGTVGLVAGANNFVVAHDDGVILTINGNTVVNEPGPTSEDFTPFTVNSATTGNFPFVLDYAECCGPPADLVWSINNVVVGAPDAGSSLMLLGLGISGMAAVSASNFRKNSSRRGPEITLRAALFL